TPCTNCSPSPGDAGVAVRVRARSPEPSPPAGAHPAVEAVSFFRLPEPRSVVISHFPQGQGLAEAEGPVGLFRLDGRLHLQAVRARKGLGNPGVLFAL